MVTTDGLRSSVLDSAKEVFTSMVCVPIEEAGTPTPPSDAAFLATITFKGGIEGCLTVHCDPPCAERIAAGMLCAEQTPAENEVVDALGEIANLVMGGVKTRILSEVKNVQISIPSVVQGRQLRSHTADGTVRIGIPVTIGGEKSAELSLLYRVHSS
jgi:chemotaxis protein CheX